MAYAKPFQTTHSWKADWPVSFERVTTRQRFLSWGIGSKGFIGAFIAAMRHYRSVGSARDAKQLALAGCWVDGVAKLPVDS